MITIELMRDMVAKMRKNDIPPKLDKHGKYYELRYLDSSGKEQIHKVYFRDQRDSWIKLGKSWFFCNIFFQTNPLFYKETGQPAPLRIYNMKPEATLEDIIAMTKLCKEHEIKPKRASNGIEYYELRRSGGRIDFITPSGKIYDPITGEILDFTS